MLTDNYYKLASMNVMGFASPAMDLTNYNKTNVAMTYSTTGVPEYLSLGSCDYRSAHYSSYGYILLGNGTTEPTREDYTMSGDILTTGKQQSASGTMEVMPDGYKTTRYLFVNNTGTEDFTVNEIGWFCKKGLLMDRTLLETPLIIPAGQTGKISYTIYFKYPTT